jgi:hypothetical protein
LEARALVDAAKRDADALEVGEQILAEADLGVADGAIIEVAPK